MSKIRMAAMPGADIEPILDEAGLKLGDIGPSECSHGRLVLERGGVMCKLPFISYDLFFNVYDTKRRREYILEGAHVKCDLLGYNCPRQYWRYGGRPCMKTCRLPAFAKRHQGEPLDRKAMELVEEIHNSSESAAYVINMLAHERRRENGWKE